MHPCSKLPLFINIVDCQRDSLRNALLQCSDMNGVFDTLLDGLEVVHFFYCICLCLTLTFRSNLETHLCNNCVYWQNPGLGYRNRCFFPLYKVLRYINIRFNTYLIFLTFTAPRKSFYYSMRELKMLLVSHENVISFRNNTFKDAVLRRYFFIKRGVEHNSFCADSQHRSSTSRVAKLPWPYVNRYLMK